MEVLRIKMIMDVCDKFGCNFIDVFSTRRGQNVISAKKVIYWILRREGLSYVEIGRMLNKDHSSVMNGIGSMPAEFRDYAESVYRKYCKNVKASDEAQEETVNKIAEYLNKGLTLKQIAAEMKKSYNDVAQLFSLYIYEKKIPVYSMGCQKSEFLVKKIKKNY